MPPDASPRHWSGLPERARLRASTCRSPIASQPTPSHDPRRSPCLTAASGAGSAPTAAWCDPAARGSAACARTARGPCGAWPTAPWPRSAWTRSRRKPCSTSIRDRSRPRFPRSAVRSTAWSARTGRSPQAPRLGLDIPQRRLSPERIVETAVRQERAPSPTRTSSRRCPGVRARHRTGSPGRRACATCSSRTATRTSEAVGLLAEVLDAANVDLKSFDDAFVPTAVRARLAHVLDAIVAYRDVGIWLELTTLVIPGSNDGDDELRALAGWIAATWVRARHGT